jgi:hypothetical protein
MKMKSACLFILLFSSLFLGACGSITINPPDEDVTIVIEGEDPAAPADEPAAPAESGEGQVSNQTMMMFLYIILALAGVAILIAFIAAMRRPDAP